MMDDATKKDSEKGTGNELKKDFKEVLDNELQEDSKEEENELWNECLKRDSLAQEILQ